MRPAAQADTAAVAGPTVFDEIAKTAEHCKDAAALAVRDVAADAPIFWTDFSAAGCWPCVP